VKSQNEGGCDFGCAGKRWTNSAQSQPRQVYELPDSLRGPNLNCGSQSGTKHRLIVRTGTAQHHSSLPPVHCGRWARSPVYFPAIHQTKNTGWPLAVSGASLSALTSGSAVPATSKSSRAAPSQSLRMAPESGDGVEEPPSRPHLRSILIHPFLASTCSCHSSTSSAGYTETDVAAVRKR
jgi:hypothetical protein